MNDETPQGSLMSNQPNQPRPSLGTTRRVIQPPINRNQPATSTPQVSTPPLQPEPVAPLQPVQHQPEQPFQPAPPSTTEAAPQAAIIKQSIYPEATAGRGATAQPLPLTNDAANTKSEGKETKLIESIVMGFGAFMVVVSALSVISWISLGIHGVEILGLILSVGELLLGVGILRRQETARSIYIVVAVIGLVLSLFGTVNYLSADGSINKSAGSAEHSMQSEINQIKKNPNIPSAQKTQDLTDLQQSLSQVKDSNRLEFSITSLVEGYAVSIAPLIFLTRNKVKQVFK